MTQTLIIDPPVSPYSPPAELEAWISLLEERKGQAAERDQSVYDRAIEEARDWLREQSTGASPS